MKINNAHLDEGGQVASLTRGRPSGGCRWILLPKVVLKPGSGDSPSSIFKNKNDAK